MKDGKIQGAVQISIGVEEVDFSGWYINVSRYLSSNLNHVYWIHESLRWACGRCKGSPEQWRVTPLWQSTRELRTMKFYFYSMFRTKRNPSFRLTFLLSQCSSRCWQSIWIWVSPFTLRWRTEGYIVQSYIPPTGTIRPLNSVHPRAILLCPGVVKKGTLFSFLMQKAVFIRPPRNAQCALVAASFMEVFTPSTRL